MPQIHSGPTVAVMTLLVVACGGGKAAAPASGAGVMQKQPADGVVSEAAIEDLGVARCERERACGRVGAGKTYASHQACRNATEEDTARGLRHPACSGGVDRVRLRACTARIAA